MINPLLLSVLSFLLSGAGVVLIYNDLLILPPKYYMFIMFGLIIVFFVLRRTFATNKKADRLMVLSQSILAANMLISLINSQWKLTNLISTVTMTKIATVILVIIAIYLNFIYMRAEQSYKKKRGNQRIKEEPKEGFVEQLRGKKNTDKNEIMLTLGKSAENE